MSVTERETPVTIGLLFADKYRVDGLLGNGGMGMVFAATHLQLETRVAIKLLRKEMLRSETAPARLMREARATAKINSDNVARILDIGTVDWGGLFIVMEYLEGEDLAAVMRKQPGWSTSETVGYLLQACEGVRAAHALGIIHRDLKPSNIFLTRDAAGAPRIKVLDFGVSKLVDPATGHPVLSRGGGQLTRPDSMIGSPVYMSPEQLNDPRGVDVRTDIWSLGVILFELLAGRPPFLAKALPELCKLILSGQPASLRSLRPELPPALEAIVERCLKRAPAERYPNVSALMKDLAPFARPVDAAAAAEPAPTTAPAPEPPSPSPSPSRPSWKVAWPPPAGARRWIALAAGVLVAVGLVATLGRHRPPPPIATAPVEVPANAPPAPAPEEAAPTVAGRDCSACVAASCAKEYKACLSNRACRRTLAAYNTCARQTAGARATTECAKKLEGRRNPAAQRLARCVFAPPGGSPAVASGCVSACSHGTISPN